MFVLLSLVTFFLFCSFETVLFWKYYEHDTCGTTLCHISNSNAMVSRHVESPHPVSLPFVVIFKYEDEKFCSAGLWQQNLTPKKQFPGAIDISGLRDVVKTGFFFHKINLTLIVACNSNSDLQPATCDLRPAGK